MTILEEAKNNFLNNEKYLSNYACKNSDAIRLRDDEEDIRPEFFHDIDRIIHSLSYSIPHIFSFSDEFSLSFII